MPYGNFIHLRAHNLQNSRIPIRIRIRTFTPLGWGGQKVMARVGLAYPRSPAERCVMTFM